MSGFALGPNALRGQPIPSCGLCGHHTKKHSYSTLKKRTSVPYIMEETQVDVYLCNHCDFNRSYEQE